MDDDTDNGLKQVRAQLTSLTQLSYEDMCASWIDLPDVSSPTSYNEIKIAQN